MVNSRQWRFPNKLHSLLIKGEAGAALEWNAEGTAIRLDRQALQAFLARMESNPFKTKSVNSFIRQLHLYGFRIMSKKGRQPKSSLNADTITQNREAVFEYWHPFFMRSRPDFLDSVQRHTSSKKKTSGHIFKEENGATPTFRVKKGTKTVSLQMKTDSLQPAKNSQLPSLKSESSPDFYLENPDSSYLHENEVVSQCHLNDLSVDVIPLQEEYFGNFESLSYSVLQPFDPIDPTKLPQTEPNSDINVSNIYTSPDSHAGQATTLHSDFGEDSIFFPETDFLGHETTPGIVWQLRPSESFSTQKSESQDNFCAFYVQEVEVNTETSSGNATLLLG